MVKIGRRFFFDRTFQKRRKTYISLLIIITIIVIIATFSITSYFTNNSKDIGKQDYKIKDEAQLEIFNPMTSFLIFFDKIENVPLKSISIKYDKDFTYEENLDKCSEEEKDKIIAIRNGTSNTNNNEEFACIEFLPNKLGTYEVKIKINKDEIKTRLRIVDNTPPTLEAKDVTITNEEKYQAKMFVESCTDNSKEDCQIDFYTPLKGEKIDYSKYESPGEYPIKIVARDKSGNQSAIKEAKLIIKEVKYYTVSFNSNGGDTIESQKVKEGLKAYSPYPKRSGYEFLGWYNGSAKFDFNTPITSDLNLTANWKSINSGGSSGGSSSGSGGGSSSGGGGSYTPPSPSCSYGKYSDYYGNISIYAYLFNGKGINDCADKNQGADANYNTVRNAVVNIANKMCQKNTGEIDQDIRKTVGQGADLYFETVTQHIVNDKDGFIGFYVTINVKKNNSTIKTYSLYNCTTSTCKFK